MKNIQVNPKNKKVNRKRNKAITIRMTAAEYDSLMEKLEETGLTQQAFVIGAIQGATLMSSDGLRELKKTNQQFYEMNVQLRGLCTNVNQLAHWANSNGEVAKERILQMINEQVEKYRKDGEDAWRSIRLLTNQKRIADHKPTEE